MMAYFSIAFASQMSMINFLFFTIGTCIAFFYKLVGSFQTNPFSPRSHYVITASTSLSLGFDPYPPRNSTSLSLPLLSSDLSILVLSSLRSGVACSFGPASGFLSLPQLLTLLSCRFSHLWPTLYGIPLFTSGAVYTLGPLFYPVVISSCWSFYSLSDRSSLFLLSGNGSRRFSLTSYLSSFLH